MKEIFKKFSPTTQKILIEGQKISEDYHRTLLTDCIITAFLTDIKSPAGEMLKSTGLSLEIALKNFVENQVNDEISTILIQPELKQTIQESARLAFKYRSTLIEPEFILFSILINPKSAGFNLLKRSNINIERLILQIQDWLNGLEELQIQDQILDDLFENPSLPTEASDILSLGQSEIQSFQRQKKISSALAYYSRNITEQARLNQLDIVSNREKEIKSLIRILLRKSKNNPIIIGEPGIGKTALVEGLAQAIVAKNVPYKLINKNIFGLDLTKLIAGTTYRGQFEERMTEIIAEAKASANIIFIDELHTILGAGSAEGTLDIAQILKPSLASGDFAVIGATTFDEYRKYIEKDKALMRRFSSITLAEPSKEETINILKNLRPQLEQHHNVKINDQIINLTVNLTERFIPERFFPDKAIDLLDEAAASIIPNYQPEEDIPINQTKEQLKKIAQEKIQAINDNNYQLAKKLRLQEDQLQEKIISLEKNPVKQIPQTVITEKELIHLISEKTGIPVDLGHSLVYVPQTIELILNKKIYGQYQALKLISRRLKESNFSRTSKGVISSFILIGPTGVGKTETARVLAKEIFGSEKNLLKFDMSEFSERHTTSLLIGAPAGYIGYEEGGKLTNAVRNNPFSVVLFDEIEKAHPDVFNLLLQILEDGYLTDSLGRRVSFAQTVVIMTSNLGNDSIPTLDSKIGFKTIKQEEKYLQNQLTEYYRKSLLDFLSSEILSRVTDLIVYQPLTKKAVDKIYQVEVKKIIKDFYGKGYKLKIDSSVWPFLWKNYDEKEGARSINKVVRKLILQNVIHHIDKNPLKLDLIIKNQRGKIVIY